MSDRRLINPGHQAQRGALRLLGGILVVVGGIFTAIGLISFFGAFGGGGMPTQFWCAFVGMPMLAVGTMLLKVGYLGTIARYVASETTPVGVDVVNHVVGETKDSIRDVAAAVGEGIRGRGAAPPQACSKCGRRNDPDAQFCDQCGAPMQSEQRCPSCREINDDGARFCKSCGQRMVAAG